MSDMSLLRVCRFAPYRRGMGPTFTLTIESAFRKLGAGAQSAYHTAETELRASEAGK